MHQDWMVVWESANLKQKIYNTLFLFVKLGRELNAFSLIDNSTQIFLKVT